LDAPRWRIPFTARLLPPSLRLAAPAQAKREADYPGYYNLEEAVAAAEGAFAAAATPAAPAPAPGLFTFHRNWRAVRPSVVHFQLRNLLFATTPHDLYYVSENRVLHWSALRRGAPMPVMDVSGRAPAGAGAPGLGAVQLCTLCVKEGLAAAGGFGGELVARRLGAAEPFAAALRLSASENGITNAIDIYRAPGGALRLACSNNDASVRLLDAGAGFAPAGRFPLGWAVNCCAAQPGGRLLCAVGDDPGAVLLDPGSGRTVASLTGHADYSFAAAWHPDGVVVATGNQDRTTRVYDLRAPAAPLALLRARLGAVRSLRFSPDGALLAAAEAADFVTVYDAAGGYGPRQTVDLFGEIAGAAFSPDGERLWVGVADQHYASAVQLDRARRQGQGG
jgi:hypothetical protein